jgi:hypothetical protein
MSQMIGVDSRQLMFRNWSQTYPPSSSRLASRHRGLFDLESKPAPPSSRNQPFRRDLIRLI